MQSATFATIRLPNISARIMQSTATAHGIAWDSLLSAASLQSDVLNDPEGWISGEQELALQDAFVEATRHLRGVWFRMGLQYRLMSFGPLGLAVLAAGTYGAGLRFMSTYRALTYSLMNYPLVEAGGEIVAIVADARDVSAGCREFCIERGIGAAVRVINDMHPGLSPIRRIELALDDGHGRDGCATAFGVPVVFDAPVSRLILREGLSGVPLPMANPLLEQTFSQLCVKLIEDAVVGDELVNRLCGAMVRGSQGFPNMAEAARILGLSERTLHRRLANQNLTFGDLGDRVRRQRATYLLESTMLSIEQIAEALGYAEAASFSRAFKRWTGEPPLRFRHRRTRD